MPSHHLSSMGSSAHHTETAMHRRHADGLRLAAREISSTSSTTHNNEEAKMCCNGNEDDKEAGKKNSKRCQASPLVQEQYFAENGQIQHHDGLDLGRVQSNDALMQKVTRAARRVGFQSVTIDPRGYRRGSVSQTRIIQISDSSNGQKSQSPPRYG